jgi:heme exporter protein D
MEDFNVPTAERVAVLEQLQEAMGGAPPYFWAACQICDLKALEALVESARRHPALVRVSATQTRRMILHCE